MTNVDAFLNGWNLQSFLFFCTISLFGFDPLKCCTPHRYSLKEWNSTPRAWSLCVTDPRHCTEVRWDFCIMLETVPVEQSEAKCGLWLRRSAFQLKPTSVLEILSTSWKAPLSLSSCSLRQKCRNTSCPEVRQTISLWLWFGVFSVSSVFEFSISRSKIRDRQWLTARSSSYRSPQNTELGRIISVLFLSRLP